MKDVIDFLRDLRVNNNRVWFNANKERYQYVQEIWNNFSIKLLEKISEFDDSVANLTLKDITYRIYRDVRFSADKSPYKTHFGTFICPGGKKSMHSGYYFQIDVSDDNQSFSQHLLCTGNYCYDKEAIQILREDIFDGWDDFKRDVIDVMDSRFKLVTEGSLKKVPKPFPADAPCADWLKLKMFGVLMYIDEDFILKPNLEDRVAQLFKTTMPLCKFINRAIDYVQQGGEN